MYEVSCQHFVGAFVELININTLGAREVKIKVNKKAHREEKMVRDKKGRA